MKGSRIKLLREEKGLKQEELAKILSIAPSTIGMYERDAREPNDEIKIKIADYFGVSVDYILGKSDVRNPDKIKNIITDVKLIPVPIVGRVPAGEPLLASENIEGYLPIDPSMYGISNPDDFFFLRVAGESMNKLVKNGSYVLIRKQDYAEDGDVIVAIVNGDEEATLKRFKELGNGFIALKPESTFDEFIDRIINLKDTNFKILGKVIGDFKKW